jgi:hypothetical protein
VADSVDGASEMADGSEKTGLVPVAVLYPLQLSVYLL